MTNSDRSPRSRPIAEAAASEQPVSADLRLPGGDRRRRVWWSMVYGNVRPRRRAPRRAEDTRFQPVDWHHSRLLAVVLCILVLCVVDAFLTLILLQDGARELNPVMAAALDHDAARFAVWKMCLTGVSVALLVFLASYRFLRILRVEYLLYAVLMAYLALVSYETYLLSEMTNPTIF